MTPAKLAKLRLKVMLGTYHISTAALERSMRDKLAREAQELLMKPYKDAATHRRLAEIRKAGAATKI